MGLSLEQTCRLDPIPSLSSPKGSKCGGGGILESTLALLCAGAARSCSIDSVASRGNRSMEVVLGTLRSMLDKLVEKKVTKLIDIDGPIDDEIIRTLVEKKEAIDHFMKEYRHPRSLTLDFLKTSSVTNKVDHTCPLVQSQILSLLHDEIERAMFPEKFGRFPPVVIDLKIFSFLCVLDLQDCHLSEDCNIKGLGNLFLLRYMGLNRTGINQLPANIGNLQFLQIIDIKGNRILSLPPTIAQLSNLKCLRIDSFTTVPEGIGNLTSLQVLSNLRISRNSNIIEQHYLEEAEVALRHEVKLHPHRPTLRIVTAGKSDVESHVKEVRVKRDSYKIDGPIAKPVTTTVFPCLSAQYMKAEELIGIEETINELMKILMERNEPPMEQGKIVSIVGPGGLGKTILARAVYEKLRAEFDCCAFVTVSQNPDMNKLFKCMLYQLGKKKYANIHDARTLDERLLVYELIEFLQHRRYIIVIDDIWDISIWKMIRRAWPANNGGCIIITTTRTFDIAEQVGVAYRMPPLCLQNSRILLHRTIFGTEDKYKYLHEVFNGVSEKILEKCGGVPLAMIMISGLLATKGGETEWYKVYDSIGTTIKDSLDEILRKILSLCYDDMPSHLRNCLLYLSVFQQGYEIQKDRLIRLWIAEGLIQCEKQGENIFVIGERYFYELIDRRMIQPVYKRWYYDMTEYCRVHDMVFEHICSLSVKQNFGCRLDHVHHTLPSKQVWWLSLQNSMVDYAMDWATTSMQEVRSLVVFPSAVNLLPVLVSFRDLRVLDLQNCFLSQSRGLNYLGNLFQLTYLGLRDTGITELSEEIGNLIFLETLDVTCNEISSLPSTVIELKHLMCLRIDSWTRLPSGIGSLASLEELSTLRIQDSTGIIEDLSNQTGLRVLGIDCHTGWNISKFEKSLVECLNKLQNIHTLSISVVGECRLDAWVVPRHLRRLELMGCSSSSLPVWFKAPLLLLELSFLSIEVRKLRQEDLEILGRLLALFYLDLEVGNQNPEILQRLVIGDCSFPCLVHCTLRGYMGPVVFHQGAMPSLARLHLAFPVRETREIAGGFDLGLGNLPMLQDVTFLLRRVGSSKGEVEEAEAALRHAIQIHPNRTKLEIL